MSIRRGGELNNKKNSRQTVGQISSVRRILLCMCIVLLFLAVGLPGFAAAQASNTYPPEPQSSSQELFTLSAEANYIPGEILVVYSDSNSMREEDFGIMGSDGLVPALTADDLLMERQLEILEVEDVGIDELTRIVTVDPGMEEQVIRNLLEDPRISYAQPNYRYECLDTHIPNDPAYLTRQQAYMKTIHAEEAWAITKGSADVIVAVVDTGINTDHEEFAGNVLVAQANSMRDTITHSNADVRDVNGHGTHVAGIIVAAMDNAKGIAGIAPGCKLMPIKAGNHEFTTITATRGIKYAVDHGANIINLSIGGEVFDRMIFEACEYAESKNVLVVAAAGNTRDDKVETLHYPAANPSVVAVAAVSQNGATALYTRNESVDIAAPGSSNYSTLHGSLGNYGPKSGSSMATPIVSAAAALLLSEHPLLTTDELKYRLYTTAQDKGSFGWDKVFGYGVVDIFTALTTQQGKFDEFEPNDVSALATPIEPEKALSSKLAFIDDIDVYKISVATTTCMMLEITAPDDLEILQPYWTEQSDYGEESLFAFLTKDPPGSLGRIAPGTTYRIVRTFTPGTYYLSLIAADRGSFSHQEYTVELLGVGLDGLTANPDLKLLNNDSNSFNAGFNPGILTYETTTDKTQLTLTPQLLREQGRIIRIQGAVVSNGSSSQPIALQNNAVTEVVVEVIDPTQKIPTLTYKIQVKQEPEVVEPPDEGDNSGGGGNDNTGGNDDNTSGGGGNNNTGGGGGNNNTGGGGGNNNTGGGGSAPTGAVPADPEKETPQETGNESKEAAEPDELAFIKLLTAAGKDAVPSSYEIQKEGDTLQFLIMQGRNANTCVIDLSRLKTYLQQRENRNTGFLDIEHADLQLSIPVAVLLDIGEKSAGALFGRDLTQTGEGGAEGSDGPGEPGGPLLYITLHKLATGDSSVSEYDIPGEPVSAFIRVSMELVFNGIKTPVYNFSKAIQLRVPLTDDVQESDRGRLAAMRIAEEGTGGISLRNCKLAELEGRFFAQIYTMTNSLYIVSRNEVHFTDLDGHWAKHSVEEAGARRIVSGVGDGQYNPEGLVTRAEFVAMAVRAMGLPSLEELGEDLNTNAIVYKIEGTGKDQQESDVSALYSGFTDVRDSDWFFSEVYRAQTAGLLDWVDTSDFMPDKVITRAEMGRVILAACAYADSSLTGKRNDFAAVAGGFADSDSVLEGDKTAMAFCVQSGIVQGTTTETPGALILDPNGNTTRAQAAIIILRTLRVLDWIDPEPV